MQTAVIICISIIYDEEMRKFVSTANQSWEEGERTSVIVFHQQVISHMIEVQGPVVQS